jgi:hypothetical protein
MKGLWLVGLAWGVVCVSGSVRAGDIPDCLDKDGSVLPVDNSDVSSWKTSEPNQYLARAHVQGTITRLYSPATGHDHFEITMSNDGGDTLEVVYNHGFGPLPQLSVGMNVEACGDFINSYAQAGGYQASPDGAIIHWVHASDNDKHQDGFVAIDGVVYGQGHGG